VFSFFIAETLLLVVIVVAVVALAIIAHIFVPYPMLNLLLITTTERIANQLLRKE
jgi:hypothetical protein